MSHTVKVKVENLTKIFGRNPHSILPKLKNGVSKAKILQDSGHTVGIYDVSFEVLEGEVFVIMGLSGSGKSTLIRCLNLLNKPTEGKIWVDKEDIVQYDHKKLKEYRQSRATMVFQHFGLFTHKTVLNNVVYGLEIKGMPLSERMEIAQTTLDGVGLQGWGDKYPSQLSGGMQQRVGLARAFATDADILLMDEPFSALDPLIRTRLQDELLELQRRLRKTIIFVSHDLDEAMKLGTHIAIMEGGRIVQYGEPEAIVLKPASDYVKDFVAHMNPLSVLTGASLMRPVAALSRRGREILLDRAQGAVLTLDGDGTPIR